MSCSYVKPDWGTKATPSTFWIPLHGAYSSNLQIANGGADHVQPADIMQLGEPRTRVPELEHQENSLACSLTCSFHRYFACPRYWKLGHQENSLTLARLFRWHSLFVFLRSVNRVVLGWLRPHRVSCLCSSQQHEPQNRIPLNRKPHKPQTA